MFFAKLINTRLDGVLLFEHNVVALKEKDDLASQAETSTREKETPLSLKLKRLRGSLQSFKPS